MTGNSLLAQIVIAALAVGIVIAYIQPTIMKIGERQDEIAQTKEELEKVTAVNNRLAELVASVNAIPQVDKDSLLEYIPEELDEVKVLKDLTSISAIVGVSINDVGYEGETNDFVGIDNDPSFVNPTVHTFVLSVNGSYQKIKQLLLLLEQNKYPLEIASLSIMPQKDGFLQASFSIVTYSHKLK